MGQSTFDIPTHFLRPENRPTFIMWVKSLQVDISTKRGLLSTFAGATGLPISSAEFAIATAST